MTDGTIDRRVFLKGAAATMALLFTAKDLSIASTNGQPAISGPPVKIGVIGLGQWGQELLAPLSILPSAQVTAICDTYQPFINRCKENAPNAAEFNDYRNLLESDVEAVIIATPSHLHKQIALDAIQAGKHVYCEAPLAITIEDAKEIASAGKASDKVFYSGIQGRSNMLNIHVLEFIRAGALGSNSQVMAQWNRKDSWRRMAPTDEREAELNWRIKQETSPGLLGEVGVHQFDFANWYLNSMPVSVMGYGSIIGWPDGRDVPDTVQCIMEYPNNLRMVYTSTLASSFSGCYTLFQGTNSSMMMRENKGWMIKEADSPLLGWEVYAKTETVFDETGICMVADSTKLLEEGKKPGEDDTVDPTEEAVYCALENFTKSIRNGDKPICGPEEGFKATVVALKANEAITSGSKINFQDDWFTI